jgi:SNF2 family DNA or RNA helicase
MSRPDQRFHAPIQNATWDLMILDEAHYLKNPSNRTMTLYGRAGTNTGIQASCHRVILLTGTPTPNHAGELYQHVRTFWPDAIISPRRQMPMNLPEFEDRYTRYRDTVYGRQVTGSKNQGELRAALKGVVLRRRKDEVRPELPPLVLQDIPLPGPGTPQPRLSGPVRAMAACLPWAWSD